MDRLKRYLADKSIHQLSNLCVSFDVGTSAVRALIGPILTPEQFDKWQSSKTDLFCTEISTTNLGLDVQTDNKNRKCIDVSKSHALNETISFINQITRTLTYLNKKNVTAIGTAVFREIENKNEIIDFINKRTGIELQVIDGKTEAYLSLIAIYHTRNKISSKMFQNRAFGVNDVILLIDQGGGSTEVSYIIPSNPKEMVLRSIPLGTRNLSKIFEESMLEQINKRDYKIKNTINKVREIVLTSFKNIDGFEDILPKEGQLLSSYNIYAYGMGTAIKDCFEDCFKHKLGREVRGAEFNGWILTSNDIRDLYENVYTDLSEGLPTINKIVDALTNSDTEYKVKRNLRLLYSIPAYEALLPAFGVNSIAYSYFNLRYGLYIHRFVYGIKDVNNLISSLNAH